jgi:RNA polymerase sigma factor (sigma-70 family)
VAIWHYVGGGLGGPLTTWSPQAAKSDGLRWPVLRFGGVDLLPRAPRCANLEVKLATAFSSVTISPAERSFRLSVLGEGGLDPEDEALVRRAAATAKPKEQDLEDVQQAVRLEFVRRVSEFNPLVGVPVHGYVWPYLVGTARHVVRADHDVRRKHGLGHEIPVDDLTVFDRPASPGPDVDPLTSDRVHSVVRSLDDLTRHIVVCRYWYDIPLAQIAKEIGLSPQSVQRRHDKALAQGREALSPIYQAVAA